MEISFVRLQDFIYLCKCLNNSIAMISKNQIKYIHSLNQKKNRNKGHVFIAEGQKVVEDLLALQPAILIVATQEWLRGKTISTSTEIIEVTEEELCKASLLQHPQQVLAIFQQSQSHLLKADDVKKSNKLFLALDGVQDPGNLGTIIRIADWFGIEQILCSEDTADIYNPKVVQATMGSIARVKIDYMNLRNLFSNLPTNYPIYGTFLDGQDIYNKELLSYGIIVMGNEGKGISKELTQYINSKLLIPNFPKNRVTADSLNVAIATAITCSEFRRRNI